MPGEHDQKSHGHGGGVGSISGVDVSSWPAHNSAAKWATKKIGLLEDLAAAGDLAAMEEAFYVPKTKKLNKYQKGLLAAQDKLKADAAKIAEEKTGQKSMAGWQKVGGKLGTENAAQYVDASGQKYYVKKPTNPERAHNEILASKLYDLAGAGVVEVDPVAHAEGGLGVASKWVTSDKADWSDPKVRDAAAEDFAVHAWLGNWDAVGAGSENPMDNIRMVNGKATLVDAGGALEFKGMGGSGKKPFGNEATEFDTLRDPSINPSAAKVFGGMTNDQLISSTQKLDGISNQDIADLVQKYHGGSESEKMAMVDKLVARRNYLIAAGEDLMDKVTPEMATAPAPVKSPPNAPKAQPTVPGPPKIPASNASYQKHFDAIYSAAASGDLAAVEAYKTNPNSKSTYTKKLHDYKQSVLASMGAGATVDPAVKPAAPKPSAPKAKPKPKPKPKVTKGPGIPYPDQPDPPDFAGTYGEPNLVASGKMMQAAADGDMAALQAIPAPAGTKLAKYKDKMVAALDRHLNPPPPPPPAKELKSAIGKNLPVKAPKGATKVGKWAVIADADPGLLPNHSHSSVKHDMDNKLHAKGEKAWEKMPSSKKDAVEEYTGGAYEYMNKVLRGEYEAPSYLGKKQTDMLKAKAIKAAQGVIDHSIPLPEGKWLVRNHGCCVGDLKVGQVVADSAILSTADSPNRWTGSVEWNMEVGEGVKGLPADYFSENHGEREIILPPGQRMVVTKVKHFNGGSRVYAKILPTTKSQWSPSDVK